MSPMHHGQLYLYAYNFHTSFIHVNILCKHISTFTFNMPFYDQAMAYTQGIHVMAIAHNNSPHINMLEHIHRHPTMSLLANDTLKQVTQWHTKQATITHKSGHEIDPKQAMNTGLKQSQAHLGVAHLLLGRVVNLGRPESPHSMFPGSPRSSCPRLGGPLCLCGPSLLLGVASIFNGRFTPSLRRIEVHLGEETSSRT